MPDRLSSIRATLETHQQSHLLAFYDALSDTKREQLLSQIEAINFDVIDDLVETYVRSAPKASLPKHIEPAPYYHHAGDPAHAQQYDAAEAHRAGEDLIRAGKIAAFTVAGGQGTRLGWNGPKGTYPATPVTGKPLFRVFAEQILAAEKKYSITIPWYIMTSPINDADTRAFLVDNNCFGLKRNNIFMFPQGVMPSFDAATGKLLLADKHAIAVNPDGHGGSIKALAASGAIEDMAGRGIEHISYFQIDNPLANVIDPLFIGLHATAPNSSAEASSKMVAKAFPEEKVGVFCAGGNSASDARTMVIEYSDLPEQLAQQRDDQGHLAYIAGSIAIHLFSVNFVEKLTADANKFGLPFHRADKKVPHVDPETGNLVDPTEPNAVKLEAFVFDALPLAQQSIVLETVRELEFAPIKNASGVDSPASSHAIQSERNARWLESHGVKVPRNRDGAVDAAIEISALTALDASDLEPAELPTAIEPGSQIVL
jgi:UDP-N-acetylglucosamine/UDP-N-acetylgalactosamine diphosphorylase